VGEEGTTAPGEARPSSARAAKPLSKAARRILRAEARKIGVDLASFGEAKVDVLFGSIEDEARNWKVDVATLRTRRLIAIRNNRSVRDIVAGGALDGSVGPATKPKRSSKAKQPRSAWLPPVPPSIPEAPRPVEVPTSKPEGAVPTADHPAPSPAKRGTRTRSRAKRPRRTQEDQATPPSTAATDSAQVASKAALRKQQAAAKAERDQQLASKRGITIEALHAERRAKAIADRELAQEAKDLGITTKELRQRRAQAS
jgi:hypothetical protein